MFGQLDLSEGEHTQAFGQMANLASMDGWMDEGRADFRSYTHPYQIYKYTSISDVIARRKSILSLMHHFCLFMFSDMHIVKSDFS